MVVYRPTRKRLPKSAPSLTTSFTVGGAEGYLTSGAHEDGELGEIFLKLGKQGSTLAGVMDAFSIAVSIGLQYGVPLETYVSKFTNLSFEPNGLTDDPDVRMSKSLMDYVFRRLALDYLSFEDRADARHLLRRGAPALPRDRLLRARQDTEVGNASEVIGDLSPARGSAGRGGAEPVRDHEDVARRRIEEAVCARLETRGTGEAHTSAELMEKITGTRSTPPSA